MDGLDERDQDLALVDMAPKSSPGALANLARQSVKVSGVSVTQSELADALGVSTRTIERWAAAGMPVLEQRAAQGRPRYNLAQCRKWAAERPTQGRHKPARAKGRPGARPPSARGPGEGRTHPRRKAHEGPRNRPRNQAPPAPGKHSDQKARSRRSGPGKGEPSAPPCSRSPRRSPSDTRASKGSRTHADTSSSTR